MRLFVLLPLLAIASCSPTMSVTERFANESRDDALKINPDLYLPPHSSDVCFYEKVGGLQDLERFYRFTVPLMEVESAVNDLIRENQKRTHQTYAYKKALVNPDNCLWPSWTKAEISWWEADLITSGFYHGTVESYGLKVWGNTMTGVVFVYQTD